MGDGANTRLWEDWWVDEKPLKDSYVRLYNLSFAHEIAVVEAFNKDWEVE